jgi:hypothetical protein
LIQGWVNDWSEVDSKFGCGGFLMSDAMLRGGPKFEGVEGLPGVVTAWQVWRILVRDVGLLRPVRETIKTRLVAGYRCKADLMARRLVIPSPDGFGVPAKPQGRPSGERWRRVVVPVVAQVVDVVVTPVHQLPPMKDWKGWDPCRYIRGT